MDSSWSKKFEETLQSFIKRVQHQLEDHQSTLQEYETFFKKLEEVFPNYQNFVSHALHSIHSLEELEKQLTQKIARDLESSAAASSMSSSVNASATATKADSSRTAKSDTLPKALRPVIKLPPNAAPKAMLIVDDAEINRVLMGHYFKTLPVKLEFCGSGADAIEKCKRKKFDLILMDLQMKDMNGLEATQKIRSFESSCPIFAITNQEPTDAEQQASLGAGCNRYLSRALPKESLIDQVSEQLFGV
jgi:CheY-like chemotaxis protein